MKPALGLPPLASVLSPVLGLQLALAGLIGAPSPEGSVSVGPEMLFHTQARDYLTTACKGGLCQRIPSVPGNYKEKGQAGVVVGGGFQEPWTLR